MIRLSVNGQEFSAIRLPAEHGLDSSPLFLTLKILSIAGIRVGDKRCSFSGFVFLVAIQL